MLRFYLIFALLFFSHFGAGFESELHGSLSGGTEALGRRVSRAHSLITMRARGTSAAGSSSSSSGSNSHNKNSSKKGSSRKGSNAGAPRGDESESADLLGRAAESAAPGGDAPPSPDLAEEASMRRTPMPFVFGADAAEMSRALVVRKIDSVAPRGASCFYFTPHSNGFFHSSGR